MVEKRTEKFERELDAIDMAVHFANMDHGNTGRDNLATSSNSKVIKHFSNTWETNDLSFVDHSYYKCPALQLL